MTDAQSERVHPATGPGFGESVTFAFGDAEADVYGSARLGLGADETASALALLFAGGKPVAVAAAGGEDVPEPDWEHLEVGGLTATIEEPLAAWRIALAAAEGGFDLRFAATSPPLELALGGTEGYEQPCRVTGVVQIGDERVEVDCRGQRGHAWGEANWEDMELSRTLGAWWDDDRAVALASVRPAKAAGHEDEEIAAWLLIPGEDDGVAEPRRVDEARLSTAYDASGHHRRAGLELWPEPESTYAVRAAGEVVCGTSLELGRLRLDAAFFRWRLGGRSGVGRYDVLRRAT